MEGQGIFCPEFYLQFRPFYPASTFIGLDQSLRDQGFTPPFQVADLGCGTGHSTVSLLQAGLPVHVTGIDPDPAMVAAAQKLVQEFTDPAHTQWKIGSAENIPLAAESIDAIIVGSAFHWMNAQRSASEFDRVLKPQGILRLFEYQFPKALTHPSLNDWIKKQFNEKWRAPGQIPRGSFKKITEIFRGNSPWILRAEKQPQMILRLTPEQLIGLILSQSRVYHYEKTLAADEQRAFRLDLQNEILREMSRTPELEFDFKLHWVEFQKSRKSSDDSS